jgi:biopolymer transport protein ExbB/TolQ
MSLVELIRVGGPALLVLFFCSVLVVALALEKLFFLSNFRRQIQILHEKAEKLILENKFNEAKGLGHTVHPLIAAPFAVLLEGKRQKKEVWKDKILRRLSETQLGLKRSLWIMATIGTMSPFIGLLGTVLGIIRSFQAIGATGKSGFNVIASGLAEALATTAAGIFVAIVAVVLFNYFQTRVNAVSINFRNKLEDLMDLLLENSPSGE